MTTTELPDPVLSAPESPELTGVPTETFAAPVTPTRRRFRLVRSRRERKLFGVCGGIARELDVDPTLIRVAFVGAAFAGFGIPLYLAAAILAPVADDERSPA